MLYILIQPWDKYFFCDPENLPCTIFVLLESTVLTVPCVHVKRHYTKKLSHISICMLSWPQVMMSFPTLNLTQPEAPRWEAAEENCHTAGATGAWKLKKYDEPNDWRNAGKTQCMLIPGPTMAIPLVLWKTNDTKQSVSVWIILNLLQNVLYIRWYKKHTHTHLYVRIGHQSAKLSNLQIIN